MKRIPKLDKTVVMYLIFGVLTTAVNAAAYYVCERLGVPNVAATAIAWAVSVLFAFVTNKLFVFESREFSLKGILAEMGGFFGGRVLTGALDVGIMFLAVDVLKMNSMLWKIISNVIVVILNYVFCKVIFRKGKR